MQGVAARDRSCGFNARPGGKSGFVHERGYLVGCTRPERNGSTRHTKRPEAGIIAARTGRGSSVVRKSGVICEGSKLATANIVSKQTSAEQCSALGFLQQQHIPVR